MDSQPSGTNQQASSLQPQLQQISMDKKLQSIPNNDIPKVSNSPIQQQQTKRKPPLPSPFLTKHGDSTHSKLALYSQAQVQQAQLQALGPQSQDKQLKNQHQISQGQIPTVKDQEEEFRQTWGKMKPRISKQLPAPFNAINKTSKSKGKKAFVQFKQEIEAQQSENFFLDKLDSAVTAEEYKQMQNLLQPLNIEHERKDKMERALTKIEQYNTNSNANMGQKYKKGVIGNLDPLPSLDGINKFLQNTSEKQLLSQSSAFSTFDTNSIKALSSNSENLRLDQMITLAVFKSTSGTVKKMLHAPSLRIFCIKEVPIASRELRQVLKDWIGKWEHHCTTDQYIKINGAFWNSPEGCVSVVTDYAANGSLQNLVQSIGVLPDSILKHLAKQILRSLDYLHDSGMTHNNISCSQILFDRKGKVKIGPGFSHVLKIKDNQTTTIQNAHNSLSQLLCEGTENFKNRSNLLKEKFSSSQNLGAQLNGDQKDSPSQIELKKLDIFDLGVLLIIAATGGLDVLSEEAISNLTNLSTSCCILHAVQGGSQKPTKSIIVIRKILNRLSTQAQDFICKCLQQRYSANEIKKEGKPAQSMNTSDMLTHSWILTESDSQKSIGNKKKQNLNNAEQVSLKGSLQDKQAQHRFKLTIKELLSVSSDWKDVNKKNPQNSVSINDGSLPMDFQSQQIEKIVEAIALTLPSGGVNNNNSFIGGTLSTGGINSDQTSLGNSLKYDDGCIRELAYDLGVDPRSLKAKLQTLFTQHNAETNAQIDKINNLQFHL